MLSKLVLKFQYNVLLVSKLCQPIQILRAHETSLSFSRRFIKILIPRFSISRLFREMASSGFEVESGTIHKPRDIENFCIDGFNKTFLVSKCACTPSFYLSVCILQYWFRYGKLIKPFLFACVSHVFVQKVWFIYIENITSYVLTSNKWALRTVHISIGVSGGV